MEQKEKEQEIILLESKGIIHADENYYFNLDLGDKLKLITKSLLLNIFYKDPDPIIRYVVHKHYIYLNGLYTTYKEPYYFRSDFKYFNNYLFKQYKDPDPSVRMEVVKKGYFLDKLYKDPDPYVRMEVAKYGKYLDILVDDPDPLVRCIVALNLQKVYLDKLSEDPDSNVKECVEYSKYILTFIL